MWVAIHIQSMQTIAIVWWSAFCVHVITFELYTSCSFNFRIKVSHSMY